LQNNLPQLTLPHSGIQENHSLLLKLLELRCRAVQPAKSGPPASRLYQSPMQDKQFMHWHQSQLLTIFTGLKSNPA